MKRINYRKLAFEHYPPVCAHCGFGIPDVLQVCHIDCNRGNNDVGNLVILCPTCHTMHDLDLISSETIRMMRDRPKTVRWSKRMKDGGKKAAATRINREVDRMFEAIDAPTSPKSYRNMSMTSSLEDVVAKGSPYYNGVRSFKRWSLIMTNKYGVAVAPYLEEAWNLIEENTKLVQVHTQEPKVQAASARVIN